jgi:cell division septation protein DedD
MLIGQPELQERLASTEMRQLAQRVSLRCELVPLVPEAVKAYISHRLTVAGNDGRVRFTEQAAECVATASSGIPRVVNLICDRALLQAARSGTSIVNAEHVVWASTDLQMPTSRMTQPPAPVLPPPAVNAPPASLGELPTAPELRTSPAVDLIRRAEISEPVPEPAVATLAGQVVVEDAASGWFSRRWLAVTAACVLLSAGAGMWATRHSLARWLPRQPSVVAPAVEATATPRATLPVTPPAPAAPVPVATPTVVLQMATFQSSARTQQAMQELRDAGYRVYSVELPPHDGERILAVLLGPYTELASAERDLDAVRDLPGYSTARVVQAVPALLPPDAQP